MKLYTEEQAKSIYQQGWYDGKIGFQDRIDDALSFVTPIELPSDEEIKNKSFNEFTQSNARTCFEEGAKWMKSKILGNNHLGGITY